MIDSQQRPESRLLMRLAVLFAIAGLGCILVYLSRGFSPWTFGLGILLGVPLLLVGMLLFAIQVFRDLRHRGAL
jgi:fatty acid desaturase